VADGTPIADLSGPPAVFRVLSGSPGTKSKTPDPFVGTTSTRSLLISDTGRPYPGKNMAVIILEQYKGRED
jgi:hypothetical protein